MKEKELQRDVLVPLFEAWGFRDVEVHQGTTEAGKDLVMWRPGDLRERLNYAVVVKAKPISGKAAGKSSAAEVRFQIEQAFSSEWYDSKTTKVQRADRCFVVCSKEIKKEAISAIQGVLNANNLDKVRGLSTAMNSGNWSNNILRKGWSSPNSRKGQRTRRR